MKEITHDDLCSMKLNEFRYLSGPEEVAVLRVPDGWIYTLSLYDPAKGAYVALSSCFVPYNAEGAPSHV